MTIEQKALEAATTPDVRMVVERLTRLLGALAVDLECNDDTDAAWTCDESAATLTTLSAENAALKARLGEAHEALRPFANVAELDIGDSEADTDYFRPMNPRYAVAGLLTVGHLRTAARIVGSDEHG